MRRRNAFTIVELLVAMALIIFIMAILSNAFVAATTTFRNLKAVGDMANKLRAVTTLLQRDLSADHFEGKKRLSNPNFWVNGPPSQGYFRVWHGSPSYPLVPPPPPYARNFIEGTDIDSFVYNNVSYSGFGSYRSTDHMLAFTVKSRGDQMGDFMIAGSQGGATALGSITQFGPMEARYQTLGSTYNYQWAEVAWFLQPQVDPITGIPETTTGGIPLYTLYRNQRLAVPDNNTITAYYTTLTSGASLGVAIASAPAINPAANCLELSCWQNTTPGYTNYLYFNSPMDLTVPSRRFGMVPTIPAGLPYATTVPASPTSLWPLLAPNPNGIWTLPHTTWTYPPGAYTTLVTPSYPTLAQQGATSYLAGADIQTTDVVSFDVRLLVAGVAPVNGSIDPFVTLWQAPFMLPVTTIPIGSGWNNWNPAFYNTRSNLHGPMVFDTWTKLNDSFANVYNYSSWNLPGQFVPQPAPQPAPPTAQVPMPPTSPYPAAGPSSGLTSIPLWNPLTQSGPIIQAIQITIRLWDLKTEQTREVTIVQAM